MLISITHKGSQAERLVALAQLDAAQVQTTEFAYGKTLAFVPRLEADVAEIVWLMEVAEERLLLAGNYTGAGHPLRQYVHPKAYAAGAILALALKNACEKIIAAADDTALDLDIHVVGFDSHLDATTLHSWLRPLGWQLKLEDLPRDPDFPEWGNAQSRDIRLKGRHPLHRALTHLQLILCAADPDHIYWLGENEARAKVEQAQSVFADHPQGSQIVKAMAAFPGMRQRFALGALFEEDDLADAALPLAQPLSTETQALWDEKLLAWITESGFQRILWVDADRPALAFRIAALPQVTKICLSHTHQEPLQQVLHQANASNLTDDQKRKFALLRFSPIFKHPEVTEYELVILRGMQDCYPKWHREAIVSMVCGHIAPKRIIWMEDAQAQFENWASSVAKNYPYGLQILPLSPAHPQLQVAIFDATETN